MSCIAAKGSTPATVPSTRLTTMETNICAAAIVLRALGAAPVLSRARWSRRESAIASPARMPAAVSTNSATIPATIHSEDWTQSGPESPELTQRSSCSRARVNSSHCSALGSCAKRTTMPLGFSSGSAQSMRSCGTTTPISLKADGATPATAGTDRVSFGSHSIPR